MKTITSTRRVMAASCFLVAVILSTAAAALADPPPAGRTYFIATVGLSADVGEPYDLAVGCLRFTATEMCVVGGDCGTWQAETWGEPGPRQGEGSFTMRLADEVTGSEVSIEGRLRVDARGTKSTIAGAGHALDATSGLELNFGFVGRHVPQARCQRLVEQYEELVGNP